MKFCMNKPYFCRNFFLTDWCHKRLKNSIDLLLFYGEHLNVDFLTYFDIYFVFNSATTISEIISEHLNF